MIEKYDNFLNEKDSNDLLQFFSEKDDFPWYKSKIVNKSNDIQFTHRFYDNFEPLSAYINVLKPILEKINPRALIRIKANLLLRTETEIIHGMHVDVGKNMNAKTAIFYVNTNNGRTIFENKESFLSVQNRFVVFPSDLNHSGTTNTCSSKCRIVLNFNYF